jgi:hypothetical protein
VISARAQHRFTKQPADVPRQLLVKARAGARIGLEDAVEVGAEQDAEEAVRARARLCRAGRAVDQRQVAKEVARPELGERRIRARLAGDDDVAGEDDVQRLSFLAFIEDDFTGLVLTLMKKAADRRQLALVELSEQPDVLEFGDPLRQGAEMQQGEAHWGAEMCDFRPPAASYQGMSGDR